MTSLFTPPTDNLYKFMALSGIVLVVAFFIPLVFFRQTAMEYLAQVRGSKELEVQEKFVNQRLETLKLRQQHLIDTKNKLQKRLEGVNSASNSETDKLEGLLKETNSEIESIEDASHELSLNLALKRAQVDSEETVNFNERRDSRVLIVVGVIWVVLGLALSFAGFWLWYKKLQRYQDRVAKKEAEDKVTSAPTNDQNKPAQLNQPVTPNQPTQANVPQPTK